VKALEKTFDEEKIQNFLEVVDEQLWKSAPLISASNEYGVAGQAGLEAGGLVNKFGFFGAAAPNISLATDPINKGVVFEFFGDGVKASRALPFYVGAGFFTTAFLSINQRDWSKPMKMEKVEGFAAQAEAGVIAFAVAGAASPNNFRAGISGGGGFGFPPVVALTTEGYRVPLFAVGAFLTWPYIRWQAMGIDRIKPILKAPFKAVAHTCRWAAEKLGAKK
jgi:hypothetical protein